MIFITGGNGLVGSFIIRKFISEGKTVKALKRAESDISLLSDIQDQINWVDGDILDIPVILEAIKDCEVVIHAAAIVSFHPKNEDEMFKVNIEGTVNMVNACIINQIPRFCFVSSVASLGRNDTQLIDEESKWVNSKYNTKYAESKYAAEQEVWRGIAEGLNAVIVNPSLVLGPGDWKKSSTRVFNYIWNEKPFYTKGSLNYVDVRDVADAVYQLTYAPQMEESDKKGNFDERFILCAGNISYFDFFSKIALAFNKKKPTILLRPFWIAILWRLEYLRSILTGSQPLITKETALVAQKEYKYDNLKIINTHGFKFRTIDESISWTCEELLKRYKKN